MEKIDGTNFTNEKHDFKNGAPQIEGKVGEGINNHKDE